MMISVAMALWLAAPPTEADRLFAKGRELLKSRPVEACQAFQQSFDLDPALGTLMNLALCLETIDRPASAWLSFNRAQEWAARTHEADREALARKHVEALAPKLSWLAVSVARPVPGLEVQLDGQKLALSGPLSVPVDPGAHALSASAPGFERWTSTVAAPPAGLSVPVLVPQLVRTAEAGLPAPPPPEPPMLSAPVAPPSDAPRSTALAPTEVRAAPAPSRAPGVAAVAGGATLAVGGAVALGWSLSVWSRAQNQRLDQPTATGAQVSRSEFAAAGTVYPIALAAVGVGAVTTGVGVWLLARKPAPVAVGFAPTPGGQMAFVAGSF